jgi:hypothetical protein
MTTSLINSINYSIVAVGCVLAFVSSFSAQSAIGYYLDFGVVLAGLVPYLVFAMAVYLRQSILSTLVGIAAIAVHLWMVGREGFFTHAGSDSFLLYGPIILGVVLIPLLLIAMRRPNMV